MRRTPGERMNFPLKTTRQTPPLTNVLDAINCGVWVNPTIIHDSVIQQ